MTQRIKKIEFGDFQTPAFFAQSVCKKLSEKMSFHQTIIEPTCGRGHFLAAALQEFRTASCFLGFEINPNYVAETKQLLHKLKLTAKGCSVVEADFFNLNWDEVVADLPKPIMFIGNPPWVTNSTLGSILSNNIPKKDNFNKRSGLAALTGKSNFDISEWMILRLLDVIQKTEGCVAMLCKTSVARKVVQYAKDNSLAFSDAELYHINSKELFNAAVDACLFVFSSVAAKKQYICKVYSGLNSFQPVRTFGFVENGFVADISRYNPLFDLASISDIISKKALMKWRSGIKHDCSKIMELDCDGSILRNGNGACVDIENEYIFPLLKSSDLNQDVVNLERKRIIVTQRYIGEDTQSLELKAPKLWAYLESYKELFLKRKSSIYRNRPPFSIFGVGDYSFAPWKIAIAGLYKNLKFTLLSPHMGKPVMLDDTCYFLSFYDERSAKTVFNILTARNTELFLNSIIFWDSKRPVNSEILQRLNFTELNLAAG